MHDDNIECGFFSCNGGLTTFTNAPFDPFVVTQQCMHLVGVVITTTTEHARMLRAEAEPWEPMQTTKNNAKQQRMQASNRRKD